MAGDPATQARPRRLAAFLEHRQLPIYQGAVLVFLVFLGLATIPGLGNSLSITSIAILASFLGIAAVGQTVIVLLGGIDLSVAALIGAANLITALGTGAGHPFWIIALAILAGAILVGVVNGILIEVYRLPSLIATFGTGSVAVGLALVATDAGTATGSVPDWMTQFSSPTAASGPIPVPPIILTWIVISLGVALVLGQTLTGRWIYAFGSSAEAASLARVPRTRIVVGAYAFSALISAVVGVLLTGFSGAGQADVGNPYLFTSIAAVLVGGNSLLGGRGDYWHTILGGLIITFIGVLMVGYGLGEPAQQILTGCLIFAAVALYGREPRLQDRV